MKKLLFFTLMVFGFSINAQAQLQMPKDTSIHNPYQGNILFHVSSMERIDTVYNNILYVDSLGYVKYKEKAKLIFYYKSSAFTPEKTECLNCDSFEKIIRL